jgi:hypothetical protein
MCHRIKVRRVGEIQREGTKFRSLEDRLTQGIKVRRVGEIER